MFNVHFTNRLTNFWTTLYNKDLFYAPLFTASTFTFHCKFTSPLNSLYLIIF